jgi:hypothetical protein
MTRDICAFKAQPALKISQQVVADFSKKKKKKKKQVVAERRDSDYLNTNK